MKSTEITRIFDTIMDKNSATVAYGGCPAFLPEEKQDFINQAYLEVVSNKITGNNTSRMAFEGSPKRVSDIQGLVSTITNQQVTLGNAMSQVNNLVIVPNLFNEENNVWIVLNVNLQQDQNFAACILLDHNSAEKYKATYDNLGMWIPNPVVTIEGNDLIMYVDTKIFVTSNTKTVNVTYIKYPTKIDLDDTTTEFFTEISNSVIYEVIDRAVVIALENIESRRTETKLQINSLSE